MLYIFLVFEEYFFDWLFNCIIGFLVKDVDKGELFVIELFSDFNSVKEEICFNSYLSWSCIFSLFNNLFPKKLLLLGR